MKYQNELLIFLNTQILQKKQIKDITISKKKINQKVKVIKVRSDFRIFESTQGLSQRKERREKKLASVQKVSEIVFLLVLLAGNTFSLYNSFAIFHYQYNRQVDAQEVLNKQFDFLTNGYKQSTFWFYMNLKLGFNLLTELVLFIIISLKVSDQKYQQYYIVQVILVILQLLVTFQSIWPFSSHSQYGFDFEKKKKQIILQCNSSQQDSAQQFNQLQCHFSESVFYMIKCAQALIIIAFISLSGISASSFLKNRYPQVLSERIKNIRIKLVPESEKNDLANDLTQTQPSGMIHTRTVTFSKIPDSVIYNEKKVVKVNKEKRIESVKQIQEDAKKNSKIRRPSFWSNSYAKTEASSSQAEDSQSDVDHSRQPSYITFSDSKKNIQGERSSTVSYYQSQFSGYQPPNFNNSWNPGLNIHKHYLDRSLDEDQLDIEENRQL